MAIKAVLFDLDGTLLPMDQDEFTGYYFRLLAKKIAPLGYDPKELTDGVWAGVAAMVKNDGSCLNEEAFWKRFIGIFGEQARAHRPLFDEFYARDFQQARVVCGYAAEARQVIDLCKNLEYRVVLATNPLFPAVATEHRIRWAGLEPDCFEWYTTYENSRFCKPNPAYYREIAEKLRCAPEECAMVGNDVEEDMVAASSLGMPVFLLKDCILNPKNRDIADYPQGSFPELMSWLAYLKLGI